VSIEKIRQIGALVWGFRIKSDDVEFGRDVWNAALEAAAQECDDHRERHAYQAGSPYAQGRVFAAEDLAHAIRSRKIPAEDEDFSS
jgi:hypothetical protein